MIRRLFLHALLLLAAVSASAQGVPFLETFTPEEYGGHCINFDIKTGQEGTVFVANFEGLMYYDYAEWRIIRTPGITRVTVVFRAKDNTIWVGGYNYFGKVVRKSNGEIMLKRIGGQDLFHGEVTEIYEYDGELLFVADDATIYRVKDNKVSVKKKVDKASVRIGVLDVVNVEALERGEKEVG